MILKFGFLKDFGNIFLQMTKTPSPTSTRSCCENGRPIMADPHTGQTICSCQYNPALLGYSRLAGLPEGVYGSPAYTAQGLVPFASEGSAFYSPLVSILQNYSNN